MYMRIKELYRNKLITYETLSISLYHRLEQRFSLNVCTVLTSYSMYTKESRKKIFYKYLANVSVTNTSVSVAYVNDFGHKSKAKENLYTDL